MSTEDHIKKWLNDELTPAEKEAFEQGEDFTLYQAIMNGAKNFKASDFSEPKSFDDFKSAYNTQRATTKASNWKTPLLRIASIVVIALGVYYGLFYDSKIHIETLASEHTTIALPDQSKVTLNAGSSIVYSKKDWQDNRCLNLEGEAYFEVAKGNIFDVITSQGTVTVVGTAFNVKQRDDYFEVQCFEGIVSVTSRGTKTQLIAGETYRQLDNKITQDKTRFQWPQWTQHKSSFKAVPFDEVITEMERQYNINIKVDQVDVKRLFTGGFMHDDIEKALLSITEPMDLTFKINGSNDVVIYGNKK